MYSIKYKLVYHIAMLPQKSDALGHQFDAPGHPKNDRQMEKDCKMPIFGMPMLQNAHFFFKLQNAQNAYFYHNLSGLSI